MQFKYLKHDLNRYFYPSNSVNSISLLRKIYLIIFTQGIWALIVYRFSRWAHFECRVPILNRVFSIIGTVAALFIEVATGIMIQPCIDIGPGLYIGHFGNIFLGGETKIGKFCNISQENTVGYAGRGDKRGLPEIGNFVYIAPGAKVIGKIRIGNNVAIGANAVVTKDVPDNAVVGGVPARILNYNSSRDFVQYNELRSREILVHEDQ